MPRVKKKRFEQNQIDPFVIQEGKDFFDNAKSNWNKEFDNDDPIILELACGKGEYTVGLAQLYPNNNFVGIDKKGDRIFVGSQRTEELGLRNVRFLRTIIQHLDRFFDEDEISEIWLIHPDPRPKNVDRIRRTTNIRFLNIYSKILIPGGLLRLKTDDIDLFDYSIQQLELGGWKIIKQTKDLYNSDLLEDHHGIQTHYEKKFAGKGRKINYLVAQNTK